MTVQLNEQVLPNGWMWATVADIGLVKSGQTPNGITEVMGKGDIPWYRVSDMNTLGNEVFLYDSQILLTQQEAKTLKLNIQPAGTIVFPKRGGAIYTNKKRILSRPSAYDLNIMGVIPHVTPLMYLWYWFMTIDLGSLADGSNVPQINHKDIEPLRIPIAPLHEQHRIVEAIETQFIRLDAAVTALKRAQTNLKRYRAAVLKAACEGRLVPTEAELAKAEGRSYEPASVLLEQILAERRRKWEAENPKRKYQEPAAPDTRKLPELPEGWYWTNLDTCAFVTKLAGFEFTKYVKYSPDGEIPVIKAENIGDFGFVPTEFSYVHESEIAQLSRSKLQQNDVLMVFIGAKLGNVALVPENSRYFLGPNVAMIRTTTQWVSPKYLEIYLRSPIGFSLTRSLSKATAQGSISMASIRLIQLALPSLNEQQRIVAEVERRLSLIDQLEKTIEADLARANRLRQSILKRAFEGKLVPQDPNDEPASVLLEHIRATKHIQPLQAEFPLSLA